MKRLISILLVLTIFVSISPASAFAEEKGSWWKKAFGKAEEVAGDVGNAATTAGNAVAGFATEAANTVADTAVNAYGAAKNAITSISLPDFKNGWDKATSFFGTTVAAAQGAMYVESVGNAITELQTNILNATNNGIKIDFKKGFVAEEWHAGTYNIDAVVRGSKHKAEVLHDNFYGSADISIDGSIDYSSKYYKSAEESAKQQARITKESQNLVEKWANTKKGNESFDEWLKRTEIKVDDYPEMCWEAYGDQVRIIPADQVGDAKKVLKKLVEKNKSSRPEVAQSYQDTLDNLSTILETEDGTKSIPLTEEQAKAIAKAGQNGEFDPSDFGLTKELLIKKQSIAKQALKGGASAAIIEVAVIIGPQIYEIVKYMIETGQIEEEQLKKTGLDGLSAATDGFLKGSISNALVVMCQAGKLGAAYTTASPELIGALTVLVIDAIRYGIQMANGTISTASYADIMSQELLISAGSLGTAAAVGAIFGGATLAICIGSFVGGLIVSAGYPVGKELVLALIDDADVDMLVPVSNTAVTLKEKATVAATKVTDALKNLKGIDFTPIKGKVIKVFNCKEAELAAA